MIFKKNSIIFNLLLMLIISIAIVFAINQFLNYYTRHGEKVIVPVLKGKSVDEADKILSSLNLNYEVVDSVFRDDIAKGSIVDVQPREASSVKANRTIYLIINAYSKMQAIVPNVLNMSERQAISLLNNAKFTNVTVKYVAGDFDDLCIGLERAGDINSPVGKKMSISTELILLVSKTNLSDPSLLMSEDLIESDIADDNFLN